jgi:hypothetical protein
LPCHHPDRLDRTTAATAPSDASRGEIDKLYEERTALAAQSRELQEKREAAEASIALVGSACA